MEYLRVVHRDQYSVVVSFGLIDMKSRLIQSFVSLTAHIVRLNGNHLPRSPQSSWSSGSPTLRRIFLGGPVSKIDCLEVLP